VKDVSIVIPCVDMLELTRGCVELIEKHTPPVYELIIVADECQAEMLDWLETLEAKVITNPKRVGPIPAINMGFKEAEGKYVAVLNNDTSVTEGWLEPLIAALEDHHDFGWVTSQYMRANVLAKFGPSCSLYLKEALDKVGLFDERFNEGEGWEDNDLLLRFWQAGYQPHGISKSFVYHPPESATFTALWGTSQGAQRLQRSEHNLRLLVEKWGLLVIGIDWINLPYL